jgi:uncharacterized protein GlcG (DUF336 family)
MKASRLFFSLLGLAAFAPQAQSQTPASAPAPAAPQTLRAYGDPVSLAQARRIVEAAEAAARQGGWTMAFAVVDPNGALVLFAKMDGTQNGSVEVAIAKARTSALFRRPTRAFSESVGAGRTQVLSLPNVVAIEGGVPIVVQGRVIGALGVSGATSEQDGQVAAAALARAFAGQ